MSAVEQKTFKMIQCLTNFYVGIGITKKTWKLKEEFVNTQKCSNRYINEFLLLLQKDAYPYEYMEDWKKFNETSLIEKEDFCIHLNMDYITDADYKYVKWVFKDFEIKSLVSAVEQKTFKMIQCLTNVYVGIGITKKTWKLKEEFVNTQKCSNRYINEFLLLLQKDAYPYEYMEDWKKFNETSLIEKEDFCIHLNMDYITDADYKYVKWVFKDFEIKSLVNTRTYIFNLIHYC